MKLIIDAVLLVLSRALMVAFIALVLGASYLGYGLAMQKWNEYRSADQELESLRAQHDALAAREAMARARREALDEEHERYTQRSAGLNAEERENDRQRAELEERHRTTPDFRSLETSPRRAVEDACRRAAGGSREACDDVLDGLSDTASASDVIATARSRVDTMCDVDRQGGFWRRRAVRNRLRRWAGCDAFQRRLQDSLATLENAANELAAIDTRARELAAQGGELAAATTSSAAEYAELDARLDAARTQQQALAAQMQSIEGRKQALERMKSYWDRLLGAARVMLWIALSVVFGPLLWRIVKFYVVAPLVALARPITLLGENEQAARAAGTVTAEELGRVAYVDAPTDEDLLVRNDHVRSSTGGRTSWLYRGWRHPFTSYAAGLRVMTRFRSKHGEAPTRVALGSTSDTGADRYLLRLTLHDHPGFVVRPTHIIAIQGEPDVRFRWKFRLANWLTGRFRYVIVHGSGTLYLEGGGAATALQVERETQLEPRYIIGYDAGLTEGLARNENAGAYIVSREHDLFETRLAGQGICVWEKSALNEHRPLISRIIDPLLNAIGKFFGL